MLQAYFAAITVFVAELFIPEVWEGKSGEKTIFTARPR
jgi:hypothetical protein